MNSLSTDRLVEIMVALSAEHDIDRLLEQILKYALDITGCDGGTVYTLEDEHLHFRSVITQSLGVCGNSRDHSINLPPVPLGRTHVCAVCALDKKKINLPDIYASEEYDFAGARQYDQINHYRTGSMLVIPMVDEKERVIGVLQLINALGSDGQIIPFSPSYEDVVYGLASLVAVCLNNQRLSKAFYDLLQSFVQVMVGAIDLRTPYNANHTKSMVRYGVHFIAWLNRQNLDWHIEEAMIDPFLMSIWLHDIGKLITPLSVMEKATRLGQRETEIRHRLTVARLMEENYALKHPQEAPAAEARLAALEKAEQTIFDANKPGFLSDEMLADLEIISHMTCRNELGEEISLLDPEDYVALTVRKGTLTDEERKIMEGHVSLTEQMLSNMKFEREYKVVPEWASAHHEMLDGSGYPHHKTAEDLPREVRLLSILDIYDALTAGDRPYKAPLPSERAFAILYSMADEGKLDHEVLDLFYESGAWR